MVKRLLVRLSQSCSFGVWGLEWAQGEREGVVLGFQEWMEWSGEYSWGLVQAVVLRYGVGLEFEDGWQMREVERR